MATFAERIKLLRNEKGITQEALANLLCLDKTAISKWETGANFPNQNIQSAIADIFDVTTDYLLGRTDLFQSNLFENTVFSEKLKQLRNNKGITQEELAQKTGLPQNSISRWENGKNEINSNALIILSNFFDVSIEELLGQSDLDARIKQAGGFAVEVTGRIPVFSAIAAGVPIEAQTDIIEYISVDYPHPENFFAVRVKGNSMIGERIYPGDYAIFRKQQNADNGQIVAALLNGETTLKKYMNNNGTVMLLPANPEYMPIVINAKDDFYILGVMVELRIKPRA